jgi:lysophospholipase L1-like esterase
MWHDEDQEEVADVVRRSDNPVVDLQDIMIDPMNPELLLSDGLHPGLEEQRTTAAALVEQLGEGQGQ